MPLTRLEVGDFGNSSSLLEFRKGLLLGSVQSATRSSSKVDGSLSLLPVQRSSEELFVVFPFASPTSVFCFSSSGMPPSSSSSLLSPVLVISPSVFAFSPSVFALSPSVFALSSLVFALSPSVFALSSLVLGFSPSVFFWVLSLRLVDGLPMTGLGSEKKIGLKRTFFSKFLSCNGLDEVV